MYSAKSPAEERGGFVIFCLGFHSLPDQQAWIPGVYAILSERMMLGIHVLDCSGWKVLIILTVHLDIFD